jgi:hypothetical protein
LVFSLSFSFLFLSPSASASSSLPLSLSLSFYAVPFSQAILWILSLSISFAKCQDQLDCSVMTVRGSWKIARFIYACWDK